MRSRYDRQNFCLSSEEEKYPSAHLKSIIYTFLSFHQLLLSFFVHFFFQISEKRKTLKEVKFGKTQMSTLSTFFKLKFSFSFI